MTSLSFQQLASCFRSNDFPSIENDLRGVRFLKLRSMSRKTILEEFAALNSVDLAGLPSRNYFPHIFELTDITENEINDFLRQKHLEERSTRKQNEAFLVDQLNRLQFFDWGGLMAIAWRKTLSRNCNPLSKSTLKSKEVY